MTEITRSEFIKFSKNLLAATGLAMLVAPIVAFFYPTNLKETPSEPVSAGALEDLPSNASKTIRFGRYPALVIHTSEGLRAFSAVCTHFACIVMWHPETGQIICPCHEGYFNPEDGSVISGPPPSPLQSLNVEIIDGQIFVGA